MAIKLHLAGPHATLESLGHDVATRIAHRHAGRDTLEAVWLMKLGETVTLHLERTLMSERPEDGGGRVLGFGGAEDLADFVGWIVQDVLSELGHLIHRAATLTRLAQELAEELLAVFEPLQSPPPPPPPPLPSAPAHPAEPAGPAPEPPAPAGHPRIVFGTRLPDDWFDQPPKGRQT